MSVSEPLVATDNQEPILFVTTVGDMSYLHLLISDLEALRPLPSGTTSLTFDTWRRNLDLMVDELAETIKARALYTLQAQWRREGTR